MMGSGTAIVFGSSGGIGSALVESARSSGEFDRVLGLNRNSLPPIDLLDEDSIKTAAACVKAQAGDVRLMIDATGALTWEGHHPEKTWRNLDPVHMARAFAINAIGPALLMKHFLPLLTRDAGAVFATLSARVGSIGHNNLGGWYSYRASKAALNQLVRCASIELTRKRNDAICVALHPGTVSTSLSDPFGKQGLDIQTPEQSAERLLKVISTLGPEQNGQFFDHLGQPIEW